MNSLSSAKAWSDRSDRSDRIGIAKLFRSYVLQQQSDRSDHAPMDCTGGPTGPTAEASTRTEKTVHNQGGPIGPSGPSYLGAEKSINHAPPSGSPEESRTHSNLKLRALTPNHNEKLIGDAAGVDSTDPDFPGAKQSLVPYSDTFPHGLSIGRRPLTYSGRVVSRQEWHDLSEWDRNGPNRRTWSGLTRSWETD